MDSCFEDPDLLVLCDPLLALIRLDADSLLCSIGHDRGSRVSGLVLRAGGDHGGVEG